MITIYRTAVQYRSSPRCLFALRTRQISTPTQASVTPISAWFKSQVFTMGERAGVYAYFTSEAAISPTGVTFTLLDNGSPAPGYSVAAISAITQQSRMVRVSAVIDLTSGALHPLLPGFYRAEFLLSTEDGQIISAAGLVMIRS